MEGMDLREAEGELRRRLVVPEVVGLGDSALILYARLDGTDATFAIARDRIAPLLDAVRGPRSGGLPERNGGALVLFDE